MTIVKTPKLLQIGYFFFSFFKFSTGFNVIQPLLQIHNCELLEENQLKILFFFDENMSRQFGDKDQKEKKNQSK